MVTQILPQNLKVTYVQPEPLPKLKTKRTRKIDMNPEKSLSAELLEDWIRPTFDTVLMPTLLDHYGAEEDFWTLDEKTANKRQATMNNAVRAIPFSVYAHPEMSSSNLKSRHDSEKRYLVDVMREAPEDRAHLLNRRTPWIIRASLAARHAFDGLMHRSRDSRFRVPCLV